MDFAPTDEQAAVIDALKGHQRVNVEAYAGCGKALRNDQPVLTPDGYRPIGQIRVGGLVIGSDGQPHRVLGAYPQGQVELAKVTVTGGVEIVASLDHLWSCQTKAERDRGLGWSVRTTGEIRSLLTTTPSMWLPMLSTPVCGEDGDLPIYPWLLGALIGDGGLTGRGVGFTNSDPGVVSQVGRLLPLGVTVRPRGAVPGEWSLTASGRTLGGRRGFYNPLVDALRDVGLMGCGSHDKVIDDRYLTASPAARLALLQGLMDTDGSTTGYSCEWGTTSPKLSEQFGYLVESLGGIATTNLRPEPHYSYRGETRVGRPFWRTHVRLPGPTPPFRYSRKAERYIPKTKYQPARKILSIESMAPASATCISVDAPDHLYLTAGCVPTHNTTTLKILAKANPQVGFFYTAFNKAIVDSSKGSMPDNVECRTTHSMAFSKADRRRLGLTNDPAFRRQPGWEQAKILGVSPYTVNLGGQTRRLAAGWLAAMGIATLNRWCDSADTEITERHVVYPRVVLSDPNGDWWPHREELARRAIGIAQRAWDDVNDRQGRLQWQHGHYLKMYQLAGLYPSECDVILLDEAQDTNGVTMAVLDSAAKAGKQIVLVGDPYQEIYQWRGSVNAMERSQKDITCHLTGSWRFGKALADAANLMLVETLGATRPLRGLNTNPGVVGPAEDMNAVLGRTNGAVMREAIELSRAGKKTKIMGGTDEVARFVRAAMSLKAGRQVEHPDLGAFETWAQVQEYVDMDPNGEDLKLLVDMIDDPTIGPEVLIELAEASPRNADVVLSTGHKAKGLEWPTVKLLHDFKGPQLDRLPVPPGYSHDNAPDVKLLYVAATRAQEHLDCTAVSFMRNYLKSATAG